MPLHTTMVTEERIAEAWKMHRRGEHQAAINLFREILEKSPELIDAFYGMGLAQKASNDKNGATKSFHGLLPSFCHARWRPATVPGTPTARWLL